MYLGVFVREREKILLKRVKHSLSLSFSLSLFLSFSLSLSLSLFQTLFLCTSKHTMNTPPHTHLSIYPFTSRYDTLSITLSGTNFIPTSLLTSIISLTKKLTLSHTHSQLTSTQSISLYALLDRRQRIKAFDKVSQCRSMYLGRSWHLWQNFRSKILASKNAKLFKTPQNAKTVFFKF